jgi:PmbA protein
VARKTSFLRDMMAKQVASAAITAIDEPTRVRGQASRPFDGEGIEGRTLVMVDKGVLGHWFLSTSAARELGLETNGRGSRSGSSVSPTSTNFSIEPGDTAPGALIGGLKSGFYVTEVFGQGVNMVTGEYSRGASGYWIEDGALAWPVSEVTIASNLKDMFLRMAPASDLDRNHGTAAPTLLIEGMTLAGD